MIAYGSLHKQATIQLSGRLLTEARFHTCSQWDQRRRAQPKADGRPLFTNSYST